MSGLQLHLLTESDAALVTEYRAAFPEEREQVTAEPDRIPGLDGLEACADAAEWLKQTAELRGKISYFLSIRESDGKAVGAAVLRHRLEYDDDDPEFASHIGYSVRPDERRQGHAKEQLRLVLAEARKIGLKRVRLVCAAQNIGSAKTILANGGVQLDTIFGEESGLRVNRYDIELNGEDQ